MAERGVEDVGEQPGEGALGSQVAVLLYTKVEIMVLESIEAYVSGCGA